MKRVLKYVGIVLGILIVVIVVPLVIIFGSLQKAPELQTVNSVHYVLAGSTVAIVPLANNQALLVDAGMDKTAAPVLKELATMGMNADSVIAIVFTHGHFDHITGAKVFNKAQLVSLATEVDLIAGKVGTTSPVTRFFPVKPTGLKVDRPLQDGEVLNIGNTEVKVFAVPGHTAGSAVYLINGTLFMGDSANATTSGELQSGTWIFSDEPAQNEVALHKLAMQLHDHAETVQTIAFGHSGVLTKGLAPLANWAQAHPM